MDSRTEARETFDLEVCVDCAIVLANGDTTGLDDPETHLAAMDEHLSGMYVAVGDEAGFSWTSCDGCGSRLGGDRFAATGWEV